MTFAVLQRKSESVSSKPSASSLRVGAAMTATSGGRPRRGPRHLRRYTSVAGRSRRLT